MKYIPHFLFLFCFAFIFSLAAVSCAQEPEAPTATLEEKKQDAPSSVEADTEKPGEWTNIIYFTGIGCPHCAKTDPIILRDRPRKGDVMVFEYEIYRDNINGPLLMEYNKTYGATLAVPQIVVTSEKSGIVSGDSPILQSLETLIKLHKGNDILLETGAVSFDELSFVKLPLKPKIWFKDRLAVREDSSSLQDKTIKTFLVEGKIPEGCTPEKKSYAPLSGGRVDFVAACRFDGWVLMYDFVSQE